MQGQQCLFVRHVHVVLMLLLEAARNFDQNAKLDKATLDIIRELINYAAIKATSLVIIDSLLYCLAMMRCFHDQNGRLMNQQYKVVSFYGQFIILTDRLQFQSNYNGQFVCIHTEIVYIPR